MGDLYPYLAIGLGLKARGHDVILGTAECYRRKIEALGLGFRAVRPDCTWLADADMVRRLSHPRWGLIRVARMVLPVLRESYDDTLAAAEGADLLVGNLATYATGLVAEKRAVPWASVMHIPTLFVSAYDPPLLPGLPGLSKKLRFLGPPFWGAARSGPQMGVTLVRQALVSLKAANRPATRPGREPANGLALAFAAPGRVLEMAGR